MITNHTSASPQVCWYHTRPLQHILWGHKASGLCLVVNSECNLSTPLVPPPPHTHTHTHIHPPTPHPTHPTPPHPTVLMSAVTGCKLGWNKIESLNTFSSAFLIFAIFQISAEHWKWNYISAVRCLYENMVSLLFHKIWFQFLVDNFNVLTDIYHVCLLLFNCCTTNTNTTLRNMRYRCNCAFIISSCWNQMGLFAWNIISWIHGSQCIFITAQVTKSSHTFECAPVSQIIYKLTMPNTVKSLLLLLKSEWPHQVTILHKSWQLSCHDLCKSLIWLDNWYQN